MKASMEKRIRRSGIMLAALIVVVAAIFATVMIGVYQRYTLEAQQSELLEELNLHAGEYDEQSIVLSNTTAHVAKELAEKYNAKLRITSDGSYATLTLPEGVTIADVYSNDENLSDLKHMSIDYQASISEVTEIEHHGKHKEGRPKYDAQDKSYNSQTYLNYLNLGTVWQSVQGYGATVAIIDTGIDTDHPEFAGRISEYSYNATEDKIVKDYNNDWSLIEDEQGHGTSVAGVLAASMNDYEITGVAPGVTILVIKAECDEQGRFKRTSDLVFGLYYAIERDVSVVNMSFGTPDGTAFAVPAQLAYDSDVICVAAAGNDGNAIPTYPAAHDTVLGVGALEANSWELALYSNFGDNVDVVAPGTVYTTAMGGGYTVSVGTSLASPLAAGVIALQMARQPYTEFKEIEERLYASCYDLGDLGEDWYYGYGAIDASAFIVEEIGTVTFNMMTDELENTKQLFVRNHTLQDMPEPERLYAVFEGWYYDPQCTEEYVWYEDRFTSDLTLYANWINEDDGLPYIYVELPDGTIEIREYTGHRKYITIPDYIDGKVVSSIGADAFSGETGLREVNLPKYLVNIKDRAFKNCANLVSIELPDTVKTIGEEAFSNNIRLSYVAIGANSSLEIIKDYAFSGCASLQSFTVPSKVTELDGLAFLGTTSMRSYAVQAGNTAFVADGGVLFSKDGATLACYPAGLKGNYTVPAKVMAIANGAFGFAGLEEINLSGVKTIGDAAFTNSSLTRVTIPDSVTTMGESAFEKCFSLKTVILGNGLTSIPNKAFLMCSALEGITIPANICEIGESAFEKTSSMSHLGIADNSTLSYIGPAAFAFSGVRSLAVPKSVQVIDAKAFYMNMSMTTLTFEQGDQPLSIGAYAFAENVGISTVVLPTRLTSIGDFAFRGNGLSTVMIPAGVASLGRGAFAACRKLENIFVADGNTAYVSLDGVVYNTAGTTLVMYPAGNARSYYDVKSGVTAVEESAFYGAWRLNGVFLPTSLQEIRAYAFYNMTALLSMSIPDNVVQISNYAFSGDYNLTNINFTENSKLPRISYGAFAYCGLQYFRVPANVSTMAQGAFEGCENLMTVTFAANSKLESISAYMFDGCNNLQSITFENGSALTSIQAHGLEGMSKLNTLDLGDAKLTNIDNFAFRFCESLTSVKIPDGVKSIGRYAFYYCTSLSEISIPASVEFIGRFAFLGTNNVNLYFSGNKLPATLQEDWDYGTSSYYLGVRDVITQGNWKYAQLTNGGISVISYLGNEASVDMTALNLGGDIVSIGGDAFANSSVEAVVIPKTVTHILSRAFYRSALKQVTIPAGVEFIGKEAFADIPIAQLTFESGAKVSVIEQSAFEDTEQLTAVTIPASVKTLGRAVFKSSGITTLSFESNIALTEIPEEAFAYTGITQVTIPDSVTLINHNAFRETTQLTKVTLGAGKNLHIGSNAFYLSGLTSVNIPANVEYIGEYAFVGLKSLENYSVDSGNPYYMAKDGLLMSKDGRKLIAVPAGRKGIQVVPKTVEIIGFGAFESSLLDKIIFTDDANVLSFGYRAFYNAKNLTGITVPSSVVSIDYYAFANCSKLRQVVFMEGNRLTGVYEGAFYGCNSLTDFELPDSIAEISEFAFYGCSGITKIPVSENAELKGIYDYAMAYTGLTGELFIPETVMDIGAYAFMGTRIDKVTIPADQAKTLMIGIGAFRDCNNVTEITVPFIGASFDDDDITWFGYIFGAGYGDANPSYVPEALKTVNINGEITTLGKKAFYKLGTLEKINLPASITKAVQGYIYQCTAEYELKNTVLFMNEWEYAPANRIDEWCVGTGLVGTLKIADGPETIALWADNRFNGIELPSSVTYIENLWSTELKNLVIPKNAKVRNGAFDCTGIPEPWDSVTVEQGHLYYVAVDGIIYNKDKTEIASSTPAVTANVVLPNTLTTIPAWTFNETNIVSIVIPEGVVTIEEYAFYCSPIRSITLPSTLEFIGNEAFKNNFSEIIYNNSNLALNFGSSDHGYVAEQVETIVEKDGTVRTKDNATPYEYAEKDGFCYRRQNGGVWQLINYTGDENRITLPLTFNGQPYELYKFKSKARHIIVPEGVETINEKAFCENNAVQTFTLPSTLKSIEERAFAQCYALKEMIIPEGVKTIETWAFEYCADLEYIYIPSTVESIGYAVFDLCESLENVETGKNSTYCSRDGDIVYYENGTAILWVSPDIEGEVRLKDGLLSISTAAFTGCEKMTEVFVPESVVQIGHRAFSNCTGLVEVTIAGRITYLDYGSFEFCHSLEKVHLPETLTQMGFNAFARCYNLKQIIIPDNCETIESGAFENCAVLESISIGSKTKEMSGAFDRCASLSAINIPSSNPYLVFENGILYNKDKTKVIFATSGVTGDVVLPDSIREIAANAFAGSDITSIVVPEGVQEIPGRCFYECTSLESVVIPSTVKSIGQGAFMECYKLRSVSLPEGITSLEFGTFWGCQSLTSLKLPDSLESIGNDAFLACYNLTTLTIPAGVKSIGSSNSIFGCYRIINKSDLPLVPGGKEYGEIAKTVVHIIDKNGNSTYYTDPTGSVEYTITEDDLLFKKENGQYYLIAYLGDKETITLPMTFEGKEYSILEMKGVNKVILPEGMKFISDNAFNYSSLSNISIPETVTRLGAGAFWRCACLEEVKLPSGLESVTGFSYSGLTSIDIPDGVTTIDGWAFNNCVDLTEIKIPDSVTYVGDQAFNNTGYSNNKANWTGDKLYIGKYFVDVDRNITELTLEPDTVVAVGLLADCSYLTKITFGGSTILTGSRWSISPIPNLKTLIITEMPDDGLYYALGQNVPITLTDIVISDGVQMREGMFGGIEGVTIYVEASEKDVRWDENFPGWSNGNRVVYGDDWIWANFYDQSGNVLSSEVLRTTQIIRQPWAADYQQDGETYLFRGFDLDGDGVADMIPATSTVDISATVAYEMKWDCQVHGHKYEGWTSDHESHWHECTMCGEKMDVAKHEYSGADDIKCDICDYALYIPGDLTGDELMDTDDALYLMMSIFFSDQYPLNQKCDFDNSGSVDTDDAIYLLMAVYFPDNYPVK